MPVVLVSPPNFTREQYEETVRRLKPGGGPLASPSDWPVEGLLAHVAWDGPDGFQVVDVWPSEEAANRFGDVIGPMLRDLNVEVEAEAEPEPVPETHTFVTA